MTCQESIISDRARMHSLDIGNAMDEDLDFTAPFVMVRACLSYMDIASLLHLYSLLSFLYSTDYFLFY